MSKRIAMVVLCVVSLSGCASFIASGTGPAPVGNDIGTRSLGQVLIDSSIERTASINLYKLDPRFKQSRVNIESFHGNVLLTGQVPDQHLRQLAEDNVRAMSDVKAVHNYLTIGDKIGYTSIMQDAAVTANTRGLIVKAPIVSDKKVLIHTENGVLYVLGRLNTAELNDLNQVLQQVGNVSKIVTLIDNTDQMSVGLQNSAYVSLSQSTPGQPEVQTPVAIDPYESEPNYVQ